MVTGTTCGCPTMTIFPATTLFVRSKNAASVSRVGRAGSSICTVVPVSVPAVPGAHASASADPDVKRGNALVAAIEPHLWSPEQMEAAAPVEPAPPPITEPEPVILPEPEAKPYDPLASIRAEIDRKAQAETARKPAMKLRPAPEVPKGPPPPPGQVAATAIQVIGWLIGWGTAIIALPYGLIRALWAYAKGQDLRKIGTED